MSLSNLPPGCTNRMIEEQCETSDAMFNGVYRDEFGSEHPAIECRTCAGTGILRSGREGWINRRNCWACGGDGIQKEVVDDGDEE